MSTNKKVKVVVSDDDVDVNTEKKKSSNNEEEEDLPFVENNDDFISSFAPFIMKTESFINSCNDINALKAFALEHVEKSYHFHELTRGLICPKFFLQYNSPFAPWYAILNKDISKVVGTTDDIQIMREYCQKLFSLHYAFMLQLQSIPPPSNDPVSANNVPSFANKTPDDVPLFVDKTPDDVAPPKVDKTSDDIPKIDDDDDDKDEIERELFTIEDTTATEGDDDIPTYPMKYTPPVNETQFVDKTEIVDKNKR